MAQMQTSLDAKEMKVEATVIRCGCGQPQSHADQPCPQGVAVPLGLISYWHRNPFRRLIHQFKQRVHALALHKEQ